MLDIRRAFLKPAFSILLSLAVSSLPVATWSAEPETCVSRDRAIAVVDPNVLDADSYGADTSMFVAFDWCLLFLP